MPGGIGTTFASGVLVLGTPISLPTSPGIGTTSNNLDSYYNSPSISTVPTPNITSTDNVADTIDSLVGFANIANSLGLIAPSLTRPSTGIATATPGNTGTGTGWGGLILLLVVGFVGYLIYRAVR